MNPPTSSAKTGAHGFRLEVRTAADRACALGSIARWRPDRILTDWMMPVIDGVSLSRLLRAAPELAGIRVFMMSALQPSGFLPVDEFQQKPFGIARLLRLIEQHTGHRPGGPRLARREPGDLTSSAKRTDVRHHPERPSDVSRHNLVLLALESLTKLQHWQDTGRGKTS